MMIAYLQMRPRQANRSLVLLMLKLSDKSFNALIIRMVVIMRRCACERAQSHVRIAWLDGINLVCTKALAQVSMAADAA